MLDLSSARPGSRLFPLRTDQVKVPYGVDVTQVIPGTLALELEKSARRTVPVVPALEEILYGPAPIADGTANLIGALRKSMATTGYSDLKEFQRVEVVLAPYEA